MSNNEIPTWAGRVSLRWHAGLVAGLLLGFALGSLLGEVL